MRTKVSAIVCALAVGTLLPGVATTAEEASPPQLMVVEHATIEPADVEEFEAWFKDWVTAFQGSGLGADYNWFTSSGPGFRYVWVTPVADYATLDAREAREKTMSEALGEETLGGLFSKMHLMKTYSRELLRMRPDLSYSGESDAMTTPGFINISVHHVRPGMEERYEALLKKVVEAFAGAEQPHGWDAYGVEFGEGSYLYTSIAASAAEYYGRPTTPQVLAKILGEEAAGKMVSEWRECISQYDTSDARPRAELSFMAAPAGE